MNRIFAILLAVGVLAAGAAHAAITRFDFSYSFPIDYPADFPGGFTSASGVMTVSDQGGGAYLITAISGQWNGQAITGLLPVGSYFDNDNLIFPDADPKLDDHGFAFAVAGPIAGDNGFGKVSVLYFDGDGYSDSGDYTGYVQTFSLTPSAAVPEPGSWALMLLGLGGLGAGLRANRRKASGGPATA